MRKITRRQLRRLITEVLEGQDLPSKESIDTHVTRDGRRIDVRRAQELADKTTRMNWDMGVLESSDSILMDEYNIDATEVYHLQAAIRNYRSYYHVRDMGSYAHDTGRVGREPYLYTRKTAGWKER